MALVCTHCGSSVFKKNGSYKGVQRYRCQNCSRFFSDQPRKFRFEDKEKALEMYLNNVGIRKTAQFIGASPALIVRWIKAFYEQVSQQLIQSSHRIVDARPDVIEMDEIYTFVKKNSSGQSYGVLIVGEQVALLRTTSEKD